MRAARRKDKQQILDWMRDNPQVSLRAVAAEWDINPATLCRWRKEEGFPSEYGEGRLVGRPCEAVRLKRREQVIRLLTDNPEMSITEVANRVGISWLAARRYRDQLNLERHGLVRRKEKEQVIAYFRANPNARIKDVCEQFNVSYYIAGSARDEAGLQNKRQEEAIKRQGIINYLVLDPSVRSAELVEMFDVSFTLISEIRKSVGALGRLQKAKVRKAKMLEYFYANPNADAQEVAQRFNAPDYVVYKVRVASGHVPMKMERRRELECCVCGKSFWPSVTKWNNRRSRHTTCSETCLSAYRSARQFKTGISTKAMREATRLSTAIRRYLKEGTKLPEEWRSSPEEIEAKRIAHEETKAKVISMAETHTLKQIAEAVGLQPPSVRYILNKANVAYPDKRKLRPDAPTEFEVACGVCSQPVKVDRTTHFHMKKHGRSTTCSPECLSEIRRRAGQAAPCKLKRGPENPNWKHGETSAEAVEKVKAYLKDNRTATISDVREALGKCSYSTLAKARKELDIQAPKMKHGLYTNNVHEVRGLIRQIKKLVREGAKA